MASPPLTDAYTGHDTFIPYLLNRSTSALNADFQTLLRNHELTLLHWRVLAFLNETDGLGVSTLAHYTDVDQTTLSRALVVMENAGHLSRQPDPQDQRRVLIHLHEQGKQHFLQVLPGALDIHHRAIQGFSAQELAQLRQFLNRIRANINGDAS